MEGQTGTEQDKTLAYLEQFDALYHRFHQAVYANISRIVREPALAEDISQEVFLALWENRHRLDLQQAGGWLFVVSYNKAMTCLKKKIKDTTRLIPEHNLPEDIISDEPIDEHLYQLRLSLVEEAINHLPPRKKEVFQLCRFHGKSYDEVAEQLGISAVSVKDYLKQSTQFIRQYISNHTNQMEVSSLLLLLLYFDNIC